MTSRTTSRHYANQCDVESSKIADHDESTGVIEYSTVNQFGNIFSMESLDGFWISYSSVTLQKVENAYYFTRLLTFPTRHF